MLLLLSSLFLLLLVRCLVLSIADPAWQAGSSFDVVVVVVVFVFVVVVAVFNPQYRRPSLASGELLRLQL